MANGRQIRIIKHSERNERPATLTKKSEARIRNSADGVKRDAVTIVSGWVQELRRKKLAEATRGFESLFSQPATDGTRN